MSSIKNLNSYDIDLFVLRINKKINKLKKEGVSFLRYPLEGIGLPDSINKDLIKQYYRLKGYKWKDYPQLNTGKISMKAYSVLSWKKTIS